MGKTEIIEFLARHSCADRRFTSREIAARLEPGHRSTCYTLQRLRKSGMVNHIEVRVKRYNKCYVEFQYWMEVSNGQREIKMEG